MTPWHLQTMARMLGGQVTGGQIVCPGPGHSPHDRSLAVKLDPYDPDRFITFSFAGDNWRDCDEHVRRLLNLPPWQKRSSPPRAVSASGPRTSFSAPSSSPEWAMRIFGEARLIPGTIGENYLKRRIGRELEPHERVWFSDLRFHPHCARKVDGQLEHHPALIVLLRDIQTNAPRAIQRIFLKPDGSDRLRDHWGKMNVGQTTGTAAKLSPDDLVIHGLGIAEGVETGLSILSRGWGPIWATIGTSGMADFPVLEGIEALTVFADHDEAGEAAAMQCIARWREAEREASGMRPKMTGKDWADVAREQP